MSPEPALCPATREDAGALDDDPELIIAKQRNGPTGDVCLTFLKSITRFESAAKVSDEDVPQ
jgi:replicative DNA helicase